MRILIVTQYYYPEHFVSAPLAEELVRRGHEVAVVTAQPNYGYPSIAKGYENRFEETINGVHVYRVRTYPRMTGAKNLIKNYLTFYKESRKLLKKLDFDADVVYSMNFSPVIGVSGANLFARKHHIKHVLHCFDLWPESVVATGYLKKRRGPRYRALYHWSRSIYKKADKILISSPSFKSYFTDVLRLPAERISFVPQPPLIDATKRAPVRYKAKINLVYAGNIGSLQLVPEFVEAARYVGEGYDFQVHILGGGALVNDTLAEIKRLGLEKKVIYHGAVNSDEIGAYLAKADACLVGLRSGTGSPVEKTIPNKVVSALYYGKPIIASIEGDGRAVLEEAGGSLFAAPDARAIAWAYEKFFKMSDEKKKGMGEANKAYFQSHFEFGKVMDQLEGALKDAKKD
jgi:glycosyltransferase involved in cell wall biosynthesis